MRLEKLASAALRVPATCLLCLQVIAERNYQAAEQITQIVVGTIEQERFNLSSRPIRPHEPQMREGGEFDGAPTFVDPH